MLVSDLIDQLAGFDQSLPVCFYSEDSYDVGQINKISLTDLDLDEEHAITKSSFPPGTKKVLVLREIDSDEV